MLLGHISCSSCVYYLPKIEEVGKGFCDFYKVDFLNYRDCKYYVEREYIRKLLSSYDEIKNELDAKEFERNLY